jgi:hypothetical protein
MAGTEMKNVVLIALVIVVTVFVLYQYDQSLFGLLRVSQGFEDLKAGAKPAAGADASKLMGGAKPAAGAAKPAAKPMGGAKSMDGAKPKMGEMPADAAKPMDVKKEGFADLSAYEGPANFGAAEAPAGCYPRDQLTPSELLPKDMNSIWAEQNPMGPGSLKGKNFLSAGALIGVNTVGQSLRNANLQLRSEPPNPQVPVSIFLQSTISPDISHRPLEIGA